MNDFEIILNLWYVYGVDGLIYSLRKCMKSSIILVSTYES